MKKVILFISLVLLLGVKPKSDNRIGIGNYEKNTLESSNYLNTKYLDFSPNDKVTIYGLGDVNIDRLIEAEKIVKKFFRHNTKIVEKKIIIGDEYFFDNQKTKLNADKIVREVESELSHNSKVLMVTNKEMFAKGVSCRGYALIEGNTLIVGDGWFMQETIIHEMGHIYGLSHCNDLSCIMAVNNDQYDSGTFCKKCKKSINYY